MSRRLLYSIHLALLAAFHWNGYRDWVCRLLFQGELLDAVGDSRTQDVSPVEFRFADVSPVESQFADVPPFEFRFADVPPFEFRFADVPPVEFRSADVPPVEFRSADVPPFEFRSADVPPVEFRFADVPPFEFRSADVPPVEFRTANVRPVVEIAIGDVVVPVAEMQIESQTHSDHAAPICFLLPKKRNSSKISAKSKKSIESHISCGII